MKTIVRWIGAALGAVVFVILVAIAWGTGLPMYHLASCSAPIDRPAAAVFRRIEADAESPAWRSDVTRVLRLVDSQGRPMYVEFDRSGHSVRYVETASDARRGWIVREMDEPGAPYGGSWSYAVVRRGANAAASTLTITEDGVIYNPVFRLAEHAFMGYTSRMQTYIADLARAEGQATSIACTATTSTTAPPLPGAP